MKTVIFVALALVFSASATHDQGVPAMSYGIPAMSYGTPAMSYGTPAMSYGNALAPPEGCQYVDYRVEVIIPVPKLITDEDDAEKERKLYKELTDEIYELKFGPEAKDIYDRVAEKTAKEQSQGEYMYNMSPTVNLGNQSGECIIQRPIPVERTEECFYAAFKDTTNKCKKFNAKQCQQNPGDCPSTCEGLLVKAAEDLRKTWGASVFVGLNPPRHLSCSSNLKQELAMLKTQLEQYKAYLDGDTSKLGSKYESAGIAPGSAPAPIFGSNEASGEASGETSSGEN
jgi:hypothetical protein